jgi:hypothetical protein
VKPGESGKYWYIDENGKFVSTYTFADYDPPSDIFPKIERHTAEVVELRPRPSQDLRKLPRVA